MDNIIAFQKWLNSDNKSHDVGLLLSTFRKQELLRLFRSNPEKAWLYHLKKSELKGISSDILNNIEKYVNGKGDLFVFHECECHSNEVKRQLNFGGKNYNAYTWGKRAAITSKKNLPFHAILLDNEAVLYKKSFIGEVEVSNQLAIDPNFEKTIVRKEQSVSFDSFDAPMANTWTMGNKKILFIRANFKGESGEVVNLDKAKSAMADTNRLYQIASLGKLNTTVTYTDPIELPHVASSYDFTFLLDSAQLAAKDANPLWNVANYDFFIVATRNPGQFSYAGRAWIGGPGHHVLTDYVMFKVIAHEFGHNLGLYHAASWSLYEYFNKNPVSDGQTVVYGHNFSIMNGRYEPEFYDPTKPILAPAELAFLGYINEASGNLISVKNNEKKTLRINALERGVGILGVKIENDSYGVNQIEPRNYWLCYRYDATDITKEGVQIDWVSPNYLSQNAQYGVIELDFARESNEFGVKDITLKLNRPYYDVKAQVRITVLVINKDSANPYIDVLVETGTSITDPVTEPPPLPPVVPVIDPKIKSVQAKGENTGGGEIAANLIDGKSTTKWLDFNQETWFKINYTGTVMLNEFSLTSANDEWPRDPSTLEVYASGNKIAGWSNLTWANRLESKTFNIPSGSGIADSFTFNIKSNTSLTQLAGYSSVVSDPPKVINPVLVSKNYLAEDDTYVDQIIPKTFFGQRSELFIKSELKYQRISYLSFTIDKFNKPVNRAILKLSTRIDRRDYKKALTLDIYNADYGWKENQTNWNNRPVIGTKIASYILDKPAKKVYAIDITNLVNEKINLGLTTFSIAIQAAQIIDYIGKIDSAESATPPVLSIEYWE